MADFEHVFTQRVKYKSLFKLNKKRNNFFLNSEQHFGHIL